MHNRICSAPYNWTLDPNRVSEGAHTFLVRAWDAANHLAQTQVSFFTRKSGPRIPSRLEGCPSNEPVSRDARLLESVAINHYFGCLHRADVARDSLGPMVAVAAGGLGTIVVVICAALAWPELRKVGRLDGKAEG